MKRSTTYILVLSAAFLFLAAAASFVFVYVEVSREASGRIERGIIDNIIFSESPVYYDDGENIVGVFFERLHRKYIHYVDIPPAFIKALISTEDKNFFSHPGFDVKAIIRALEVNIRAGKVIQGGSTITQQTAKNVFKRERRSLKAKIKELMQAILLEKEYSKEEILEMYANQFFVTGFGRGLRIASQYFFDKEAEDLDLAECAFIAGSVKSPNRYNPFTKKTDAEKEEAKKLAKMRKDYVLGNMLQMSYITKEQYEEARKAEVPFKEGKVTYRLNVILDYIREQLESDYFKSILEEQGVDNIATSGIRIYTSINKEIQEGALRSIRRHLPVLDVKLSGYGNALLQSKQDELTDKSLRRDEKDVPFLSRITHIEKKGPNPYLVVAWDKGGGVIDYDGLRPMGEAWLKGQAGDRAVFGVRHVPDFLNRFHVGDLIPVQVMDDRERNGQIRLALSEIPELEGGIIVVQRGMVKAMVGGFFDRFFNRAVDAKRQLGSIFKPIVYAAALQLKWSPLDPLINKPDLFRFESTFYVPKPDHQPKSPKVSMAWAGCKSENLATVWLLYHLTDRLNMSEFRQVAEGLGLTRKKDESYTDYVERIRDGCGVVVDREALMETAFEEAKKEIESDLIFAGWEEALPALRRLHYNVDKRWLDTEKDEEFQIHQLSFARLQSLSFDMKKQLRDIQNLLDVSGENRVPEWDRLLSKNLRGFYYVDGNGTSSVYYSPEKRDSTVYTIPSELASMIFRNLSPEAVWIDGIIPAMAVDLLQGEMRDAYQRLTGHNRYDPEVLYKVGDFKRLVNLHYVIRLAKKMGISTPLDPVLSFPLGANAISILEAALVYQAITTGKIYPLDHERVAALTPIITKIEDRMGKTLWEYEPHPETVLSVSEILRLVMENGTGRSANDSIKLKMSLDGEDVEISVPAFGKTGTSNRFTNSSFVGIVPGPYEKSSRLGLAHGYAVASYVGYDDNRAMKGDHVAIYGASGALPLWIDTVNALLNSRDYKKDLQVADLVFNLPALQAVSGQDLKQVRVSPESGLPLDAGEPERGNDLPHVAVLTEIQGDRLFLHRTFEPLAGDSHETF
ncbi:MAG: transglycosylase domain-containing protein [Deltaproteobacteria bacterium]